MSEIQRLLAIVHLGENAARLLSEQLFISALNDVAGNHLSSMALTPPGEEHRVKRDTHHARYFALREVAAHLEALVSEAQDAQIRLEQIRKEDETNNEEDAG